jgi:TusA-related sulfurtransferase
MHTALGIGCICGKSAFALWYIAHQENSLSKIMTTEPKSASNPASKSTGLEIVELDVTGLNCPMPLLKAKKALNEMQAHQQLRVRATDPWVGARLRSVYATKWPSVTRIESAR